MKILNTITLIFALQIITFAQYVNYQNLGVPTVDGGGKVYNADKGLIGKVNKDGEIFDAKDVKVAKFDAFSNVLEEETGTNFGKSDAEGNHLIVVKNKVISWKSNHPENPGIQVCLIKDKNGKIVGGVNKVHKQYGTGALYYLVAKFVKSEEVESKPTSSAASKPKAKAKSKTKVVKKTVKKKVKK